MADLSDIDLTYKLVIGLFNAAPGKTNLVSLLSAIDDGLSLPQVSDRLDSTLLFNQKIIGDLSEADQVSLIMSHFGFVDGQSTGNERKQVRDYLTGRLKSGDSWGQIVYDAIVYLSGNPDPMFAKAALLLSNKALVSSLFSQSYSEDSLEMLQSVLSGVSADSPLDQVSAEAYLAGIGKPVGAVNLTVAKDVLSGHIILAPRGYTPAGTDQINTLNDDDVLSGTASEVDKLAFDFVNDADTGDHNIVPQLSGIEILDIKFSLDGAGTLDLQDAVGVTHIDLHRIDDGATAMIDNITEATTNHLSINRSNVTDSNIAFTYLDSALIGTDDVVTLTLNSAQAGMVSIQESTDDGSLDQGFETINMISSGDQANTLISLTTEDAQLLNITGNQDLTIQALSGTNQSSSVGLQNMGGSLTKIDASTFAGNLRININGLLDAVLDDSSGKDVPVTVLGGIGNDTIWLSSKNNVNDELNGGTGVNTLILGGGFDPATVTELNPDKLKNIVNFSTLASTNFSLTPELLKLQLDDLVLDSLVDSEHISSIEEPETFNLRINDFQDIEAPQAAVALRLDISDLTQQSAINVTLDAGSPHYQLEHDTIQLSPHGSGIAINNFQTLSDGAVVDVFGGSAADQIVLSLADFKLVDSSAGNNIAVTDFLFAFDTIDPTSDPSAEAIIFDSTTGNLFYNPDHETEGGLVLIASLTNISDLTDLDIFILS